MNAKQPSVSVVMTNYNYDAYLREALDSAVNQTYSNLEIIVVDDGSTDRSREILARYGHRIIPVFQNNRGQAATVNRGIAASRGEIICFLDSDDIWLPTKVEEVVKAIANHPKVAAVYHKVQNIDKYGQSFSKPWPPYRVIQGDISDRVVRAGGWWPWPPSSALAFTRDFLDRIGKIPEGEYRRYPEAYPADLAPFFGEVVGIDRVLSYFRLHGANNWSTSVNQDSRNLQEYEVRNELVNRILLDREGDIQLSLDNHLPYQQIKYRQKKSENFENLSRLIWQNPWNHSFPSKCKALLELWYEHHSPKKSR